MYNIHLKANQCFHKGDGYIGEQVISSAFKHGMSKRKKNPNYHVSFVID